MQRVFVRTPGAESAHVGSDCIVLDPQTMMLRGLNPVAARIWELLTDACPLERLVVQIAEEFEVPLEQCREDVPRFIAKLRDRGLVREESSYAVEGST